MQNKKSIKHRWVAFALSTSVCWLVLFVPLICKIDAVDLFEGMVSPCNSRSTQLWVWTADWRRLSSMEARAARTRALPRRDVSHWMWPFLISQISEVSGHQLAMSRSKDWDLSLHKLLLSRHTSQIIWENRNQHGCKIFVYTICALGVWRNISDQVTTNSSVVMPTNENKDQGGFLNSKTNLRHVSVQQTTTRSKAFCKKSWPSSSPKFVASYSLELSVSMYRQINSLPSVPVTHLKNFARLSCSKASCLGWFAPIAQSSCNIVVLLNAKLTPCSKGWSKQSTKIACWWKDAFWTSLAINFLRTLFCSAKPPCESKTSAKSVSNSFPFDCLPGSTKSASSKLDMCGSKCSLLLPWSRPKALGNKLWRVHPTLM